MSNPRKCLAMAPHLQENLHNSSQGICCSTYPLDSGALWLKWIPNVNENIHCPFATVSYSVHNQVTWLNWYMCPSGVIQMQSRSKAVFRTTWLGKTLSAGTLPLSHIQFDRLMAAAAPICVQISLNVFKPLIYPLFIHTCWAIDHCLF